MRKGCLSILLIALSGRALAGSGAYVVDDASITPAGKCQAQSWYQLISGGQETLNTLPACSTGPVEWSLGIGAQNDPYEHQESPAVKWMILDPDHHTIGVALNIGATWGQRPCPQPKRLRGGDMDTGPSSAVGRQYRCRLGLRKG
jgi:hypothetical protein